MNIVLINPPNTYELQANDPAIFKGRSQGCLPPLGLLYTASAINPKHKVSIIDCQAQNLTHDDAVSWAILKKADVIGISVMTFTLIDVKILITKIKERMSIPVIVGGPHATIYPQECLDGLGADHVIVGESETQINWVLDGIHNQPMVHSSIGYIERLDELNFPNRHLVDNSKYYSILSRNNPTTSIFSSRGCPFSCKFCDRPALGKNFRAMSAERVVGEMQECVEHGARTIMFYDDTFTIDKDRVHKICETIKKRGLSVDWDVRARVDTVDYELLQDMASAGCKRIHFGVESASDKVRRALRKNIILEQVERAFSNAKHLGIETLAYFMIGCPEEDWPELRKTLDYSMRLNADYVSFTIFTPFPHTELYKEALDRGLIDRDVWKEYADNPTVTFTPPVWGEFFSRSELQDILTSHLKKFYLSPRFIMKKMMRLGSFGELTNLMGVACKLIMQ